MGKKERDKGGRGERNVVHWHIDDLKIPAKRVPLSGASLHYKGDVIVVDLQTEVKSRKDDTGFGTIKKWLGDNDMLFIKEDRKDYLVVLPQKTYEQFIALYYKQFKGDLHGEGN